MARRPAMRQSAFNSGELGPAFLERPELKYFNGGLALAENVEPIAQGGFTLRAGLRHVGETLATACQLVDFLANNGNVYDLAFANTKTEVWGSTTLHTTLTHDYTAAQCAEITWAQQLDTLITFHEDVAPKRFLHASASSWTVGDAPLENIPTYDYGAVYTNGVAARWNLEAVGFKPGDPAVTDIAFTVTVNGRETQSVLSHEDGGNDFDEDATAPDVEDAILDLPNIAAGLTVVGHPSKANTMRVEFAGADNLGDQWVVSARVINKPDAAMLAFKERAGVEPGEPIISSTKGWPRCGAFIQQRLWMGGLKSLPNTYMLSINGDYFNFDERDDEAGGAFRVPMDTQGGEAIERIVANRNPLIFTNKAEYWISNQAVKKTEPLVHVQASRHGTSRAVPIVENEGAAVFIHESGDVVGEFRYTDADGNFAAQDISLLGYHLIEGVTSVGVKKAASKKSANTIAMVQADGTMRHLTLLREQELTAYARVASAGSFKAVSGNGRNELTTIVERAKGASVSRRIERFEKDLLLDGAITISQASSATVTGLGIHAGQQVWAIANDDVFGPFTVTSGGAITLPVAATSITVGRWTAPRAITLPYWFQVAERFVTVKRGRIFGATLALEDTTSLAVSANGGKVFEIDLLKYGLTADVGELAQGFTGQITLRGFTGYVDNPQFLITQTRPGRLTVKSVMLEAA